MAQVQDQSKINEPRIIELGGGANPTYHPNVDARPCYDSQGNQTVDFTANFEEPLPINSEEWDGVFCKFCLEHLPWPLVPNFLQEVFRILKPEGKALFITPNTEAQLRWVQEHPDGWDNKTFFESASEVLFGSNDYAENSHKSYLTPAIAQQLFAAAGFVNIMIRPYGERHTDMQIEAMRPNLAQPIQEHPAVKEESAVLPQSSQEPKPELSLPSTAPSLPNIPRDQLFGKDYFNGGHKWGGYASDQFGAYRDFPVHEVTARHVLKRMPKSVLEVGCGRGYIGKRIQDAGVLWRGIEISRHCYLTRVADGITNHDICGIPWRVDQLTTDPSYSLCFSIATMEHIPEETLPAVIKEMARTCKRGLHGIDFGERDDGFDRTHCTLKPRKWWLDQFALHAPGWPVEIVDKEELERGVFPEEVARGDSKVKLNLGSHVTMFHHGWTNIDVHNLHDYAKGNGYNYQQADLRAGIPYGTQTVDLIMIHHALEHFTYSDGLQLLRDCRRVLKPNGAMRIVVPDVGMLAHCYSHSGIASDDGAYDGNLRLSDYDEINDESADAPTAIGKLWALAFNGHQAAYDKTTLIHYLQEVGFVPKPAAFRQCDPNPSSQQILRETIELFLGLGLFMDALPAKDQ